MGLFGRNKNDEPKNRLNDAEIDREADDFIARIHSQVLNGTSRQLSVLHGSEFVGENNPAARQRFLDRVIEDGRQHGYTARWSAETFMGNPQMDFVVHQTPRDAA